VENLALTIENNLVIFSWEGIWDKPNTGEAQILSITAYAQEVI